MSDKTYKLAVFESGQGNPVVLLHGTLSSHTYWNKTIQALDEKRKVYAIDLLGFGSSPKPVSADYTFQQHVDCVLKAIDDLGIDKPVVLVGHSLGAMLGLYLAKHYPDKVKSLILTSLPLSGTGSRYVQMMEMLDLPKIMRRPQLSKVSCYGMTVLLKIIPAPIAPYLIRDYDDYIARDSTRHSITGLIKTNNNAIRYTEEAGDLQSLNCTVILMYGDDDKFSPNPNEILGPVIPSNAELIIEHGSHHFPLEHPDIVAKAILQV